MKRTVRLIALAVCIALTVSCFCIPVGADASKFDSAVEYMRSKNGVRMKVTAVQAGETMYAELIHNTKDGDTKLVGPTDTYSLYYVDVNSESPEVVAYLTDVDPQPDGWYAYGIEDVEFYAYYDFLAEFAFLNTSFADSCFYTQKSGSTTILTARDSYENEVAYSFFGDYSYEGVYDKYNHVKIYIKDGYITKLTADNTYGYTDDSDNVVRTQYTVEFDFDSFKLPEYDYIRSFKRVSNYIEFPINASGPLGSYDNFCYSFTPTETCTVRFYCTELDLNTEPAVDIMLGYGPNYGELLCTYSAKGDSDGVLGVYTFYAGQTYYIDFYSKLQTPNTMFRYNTREVLFYGYDVTGDGKLNTSDAAAILRYDVGLEAFSDEQLEAADANKDHKVNAMDASAFLQYNVGLIRLSRRD